LPCTLSEFIVNLARDVSAFFFPHFLKPGRKGSEFVARIRKLLFGALTFGDFGAQLVVHASENGSALLDAKLGALLGLG